MSPILFFKIFFTCTGVGKIILQINPAAVAFINILIAAWEGLKYSFSNVTYIQCYNIMQSLKKKKNICSLHINIILRIPNILTILTSKVSYF